MKIFVYALAIFALLPNRIIFAIPCGKITGPEEAQSVKQICYETDGHYWTVLVIATQLKIPEAKAIAFSAEYPDNIINSDGYCVRTRYTFMYPKAQRKIHALTGGNPEKEKLISLNMFKEAKTAREKGIAAHRLGDSFAHINDKKGRMYPHLIGHTFQWKEPDKIKHNSSKYLMYVCELIAAFGGPDAQVDMSVFNYVADAGLSSDTNSAILKAEYNLLNHSLAFNIEKDQVSAVERYLKFRLCTEMGSYAIYSSTDRKKRVTTTVILTNISYTTTLQSENSSSSAAK